MLKSSVLRVLYSVFGLILVEIFCRGFSFLSVFLSGFSFFFIDSNALSYLVKFLHTFFAQFIIFIKWLSPS